MISFYGFLTGCCIGVFIVSFVNLLFALRKTKFKNNLQEIENDKILAKMDEL